MYQNLSEIYVILRKNLRINYENFTFCNNHGILYLLKFPDEKAKLLKPLKPLVKRKVVPLKVEMKVKTILRKILMMKLLNKTMILKYFRTVSNILMRN